jgi:hypothetical protein
MPYPEQYMDARSFDLLRETPEVVAHPEYVKAVLRKAPG